MMCYACRNEIDHFSTRCAYCTSAVEPYTGLRPNSNPSQGPNGFGLSKSTPEQEKHQKIMVYTILAILALLLKSWALFCIVGAMIYFIGEI